MTDSLLLLVWRDPETEPTVFAEALHSFARSQVDSATPVVQCNLADGDVVAAAAHRQRALDPAPEALLRVPTRPVGIDPADTFVRIGPVLGDLDAVAQVHGYAVQTREPLADHEPNPGPGERRRGWSQLALLRHAPGMDEHAFRTRWLDHHTGVAIDTQSTFRYVQHLVEASVSNGAPHLDGIVEECFPADAMDDPHVFFATGGDPDVLDQRITTMVDSVSAFLDLGNLDVIPTSEYRFDR